MTTLRLAAIAAALLASASLSAPLAAQAPPPKVLLNLDRNGLALQGYDPVAYFTDAKAVKGDPSISSRYLGATYYFATREHKALFESDSPKYAPQFGGYCGYAASQGHTASIDPEAFTIMNGRLILQNSRSVLQLWQKDPSGLLIKADANWPGLVEKEGKPSTP